MTNILYSCYTNVSREGEQFIPEHVFSYQISGKLQMYDGNKLHVFEEGDFRFLKRNHLVKFTKIPPENGEFKALSVRLDQQTLRDFSREHGYNEVKHQHVEPILSLKHDPLYKSFMDSLTPYQLKPLENQKLMTLKLTEAILILLQTNPELAGALFDFAEPGKIDLEAFMNKNFRFNVEMKRFAYLTGRSLATFKRDFGKLYQMSPGKWLQNKRLQEAYHLLKEKGKTVSDVYLEVGFEDLSHFSFVFKKKYGLAPSKI
ncbi:AraC family transcriptional regulator [Pedobacter lusitanus]|uniref:AraC family transcriptional regulator n=1 Tax=Pedobacter lusitanus TaxID=1503925 RepID=A0A0D0GEA7_9SPHI|nr:AraC family transcriptional regulator [Pedobacter lusitanus]KIO75662.1 AraC family transcriptional regulator [Pedobacter lusitanus]